MAKSKSSGKDAFLNANQRRERAPIRHDIAVRNLIEDEMIPGFNRLRPFRKLRMSLIGMYAGAHYPGFDVADQPFPVFHRAMMATLARLAGNDAEVIIDPKVRGDLKAYAKMMSHRGTNILLENNYRQQKGDVLIDALTGGFGIMKTGLAAKDGGDFEGEYLDEGEIYIRRISPDDFGVGSGATNWDDKEVVFHRYSISDWYLLENDLMTEDEIGRLPKATERSEPGSANRGQDFDSGNHKVDLIDIWVAPGILSREAMIITIPGNPQAGPSLFREERIERSRIIQQREYVGPDGGPYSMLTFNPVPDNVFGSAPFGYVKVLSHAVNNLGMSILDAEMDYKKLGFGGGNHNDSDTIRQSRNGDFVELEDPGTIGTLEIGGASPHAYSSLQFAKHSFNQEAGNSDLLSGVGGGGKNTTATEIAEVSNSQSVMIDLLDRRGMQFDNDVVGRAMWHEHSNPMLGGTIPLEAAGIVVPVNLTPEVRGDADYYDFNFTIRVGSMRLVSPEQHTKRVMEFMANIVMPAIAMEQSSQGEVNARELIMTAGESILPSATIERLIRHPNLALAHRSMANSWMSTQQMISDVRGGASYAAGGGLGGGRNSGGSQPGTGIPGSTGFPGGNQTGSNSINFDRNQNTQNTVAAL